MKFKPDQFVITHNAQKFQAATAYGLMVDIRIEAKTFKLDTMNNTMFEIDNAVDPVILRRFKKDE